MVFNNKDQSSADFMSNQSPSKHTRHLAYDDQISLFAEDSTCNAIPAKFSISDEEQKNFSRCHKDFEIMTANPPYEDSVSDFGSNLSLSQVTGKNSEVIWSRNGKRLLFNDETHLYSKKHLKQAHQNLRLSSFEEAHVSASEKPSSAAAKVKNRGAATVPGVLTNHETTSYLFTRSTSNESVLNPSVHAPPYSSYFGYNSQATKSDQVEEICLEYFGRKHVAIGGNNQAYIPEWRSHSFKNHIRDNDHCTSQSTNKCSPPCDDCLIKDDSDKRIGTCVVPMPDSAQLATDVVLLNNKVDCSCQYEGSIRCVREHLMEERENLKHNLGDERFVQLGFGEMGEDVSQKWSAEEEQLFHNVVMLNPASLGKNFWKELAQVFPDRCSKELVSYYFNVFMLRKRAEQNRLDPRDADSDDDEWQKSGYGKFAMVDVEEEEGSVVESPTADQDDGTGEEDDLEETEFTEKTDLVDDYDYYAVVGNNEKGTCGDAKGCIVSERNFHSSLQFARSKLHHSVDEQDIQGDSCTSFEGHHTGVDSGGSVDIYELRHGLHEDHKNLCEEHMVHDSLSEFTDNAVFDSHCDPKPWNTSYCHVAEKDDFLATWNVIEEVFGKESQEK